MKRTIFHPLAIFALLQTASWAAAAPLDGACLYGAGVIGEPPAGLVRTS